MHIHSHGHQDSGHDHGAHGAQSSERRVALVAALTGVFMVAEFVGGLVSGSLALIADAGHMLTDFAGLMLAWIGFRMARRPADWKRTYGYDRYGVLVAFTNGLMLFAIAGWIVVEAVHRLKAPSAIESGLMLWVAAAGLLVNLLALWLLRGGGHDNLNMRAAVLHVMGDLLGSLGAIAAALIIMATGWTAADPLLSVLVALLILVSAGRIVRESGHILLEGAPSGLDPRQIAADIQHTVPEITEVFHVHAWSLSQERPLVTLHARLADGALPKVAVAAIKAHLKERFGIAHSTVEIAYGPGAADDPACPAGPGPRPSP